MHTQQTDGLQRHFGLLQAVALNVTMVVGAGVFATIPLMLKELPGPYALLGWLGAGLLILVDGVIWSELGAALPGSGGSYLYLLECYGRDRWGRLLAFLFIWQFLISGPLEIASGLIAVSIFANGFGTGFQEFNKAYTWDLELYNYADVKVAVAVNPARLGCVLLLCGILLLLYRRITGLGKLTVTFWLGVLAVIGWILVEGMIHFDPGRAFAFSGQAATLTDDFGWKLGVVMILAMYSYLGYYNVCYIGDEVRDPGRTIPRAILLSVLLVCVLFVALHLAMLGTVPWQDVPRGEKELESYSLPAEFMARIHEPWAVGLVSALLIWSCVGSAFTGLLGYSRIPYGAARYGHFFRVFAAVHPVLRIPHVALLFVGALTLFWSFFDLQTVINALIVTRIPGQFIAQIGAVMLLRHLHPERPRPYRMWLYPLPCLLALAGWLYLYVSAGLLFILIGLGTLSVGVVVFLLWSWRTRGWPFDQLPPKEGNAGKLESL
jgi:amino acid transporter